jgi:hypothetical protein
VASVWSLALEERYGRWSEVEQGHLNRSLQRDGLAKGGPVFDKGRQQILDSYKATQMPVVLVVPWGTLDAPEVDEKLLFRGGDQERTRDHRGFTMWFNVDAPDRELRDNFELVLRAARKRWPFSVRGRGRRAANPASITRGTFQKWWDWKIVQLCDLDCYFFYYKNENDYRSPPAEWLCDQLFPDQKGGQSKKISEARKILREAMYQHRIGLHHMVGPVRRVRLIYSPPKQPD